MYDASPAAQPRFLSFSCASVLAVLLAAGPALAQAQTDASSTAVTVPAATTVVSPLAIVPLDSHVPGSAAVVTGALQVVGGRALIASNGSVTSGSDATEVSLPRRGSLRICSATTVKIASDANAPAGEMPGLLLAMDHGAVEANITTGQNADTILTPDFRILIGAPGPANVKVRLGQGGDTCVDNPGTYAPYVLVTSVFDGRLYRVQPGQRVMFQHGSLDTVVDQEKEPCGCPPAPAQVEGNEFPLAQSEGLAPSPTVSESKTPTKVKTAKNAPPLVYSAGQSAPATDVQAIADKAATDTAASEKAAKRKKPNLFTRIGHMFRRIFGAE
ncbi:MAG TPA: hypothetical protein VK716_08450 [Terracidiphilus sp.]|jgi:hypothetical protein|nr:hypothetical protein [Terracidiphilus sp.]